jgi:hypothetical protein
MLFLHLLLLLLFLARSRASADPSPVVDLRPESPLVAHRVPYGVPQLFRVSGLQPGAVYDVKVSFPATQPSLFSLRVERVLLPLPIADVEGVSDVRNAILAGNIAKTRRKLLNTAKLRLHPQELEAHESVRYRLEPSGAAVEVELSLLAEVEGVQRPDSKLQMNECEFDLVVEQVLLEAFPRHTLVLVAWLLLLLAVSAKYVWPYLEKKMALGCVEDRVETKES